ncbi:MAG: S9 family peptidase [Prolixibacteraceae bacterium]|nr:S9 family peptidase [Prolixibacteraceae bacterium]
MKIILSTVLVWLVFFQSVAQKQIALEDLFQKRTFSQNSVYGLRSMKDGIHYTVIEGGTQIVKYSYKTGEKVAVVFDLGKADKAPVSHFSDYEFSPDETKILLTTDVESIYRRSYTANYYVWNSVLEELKPLSENGKQQLATFSPDGERIAFVRNNNLFMKSLSFGSESQITYDGERNKIINGAPDWVYEEEFGFNKAFAWSPDSKFLAFIKFDESGVREFDMSMFRGQRPSIDKNALYPGIETFKYPKAGEKNSDVKVMTYEIRTKVTTPVDLGNETDQYIPRIRWTPHDNNLVVMRMNRHQNQLDVLYANPFTGEARLLFRESNEKYIDDDFFDKFVYLPDGRFVLNSERDGFSHLYLYDANGFQQAQLTKGDFDVTGFYGYDNEKKLFYYQAAAESPLRREVYFTSIDGKKKGKLSTMQGSNNAVFSAGFQYYINYFNNAETPNLVTLHDSQGKTIRTLEDNKDLTDKLKEYSLPKKEFFTFKTGDGIELNGWMLKPNGFDTSRRYPVLITQYSGPNSQQVLDNWNVGWNHYLAQEGFLVVSVDPRGTGARGENFRKATYLQLGKYESDDMVEAARYLASLPYVDAGNIAIWGWSYGGFMTALTMSKGGELFKAGISVAPVTSWRFYDSIYTERYMRTPGENAEGYDNNSPIFHADGMKGRLLLIHGSADDNVHAQNTMEYSEALVQAGVQFDMFVYTNRNHGIYGGNTTMHLYKMKTDFLKRELQGK